MCDLPLCVVFHCGVVSCPEKLSHFSQQLTLREWEVTWGGGRWGITKSMKLRQSPWNTLKSYIQNCKINRQSPSHRLLTKVGGKGHKQVKPFRHVQWDLKHLLWKPEDWTDSLTNSNSVLEKCQNQLMLFKLTRETETEGKSLSPLCDAGYLNQIRTQKQNLWIDPFPWEIWMAKILNRIPENWIQECIQKFRHHDQVVLQSLNQRCKVNWEDKQHHISI